jgi:hypothetical protein
MVSWPYSNSRPNVAASSGKEYSRRKCEENFDHKIFCTPRASDLERKRFTDRRADFLRCLALPNTFLCRKRRKNIITRFREHSTNKFHGESLVYVHVTCSTCAILEEHNSFTQHMYTVLWWESLKERDSLVKTGVDGWIILNCI